MDDLPIHGHLHRHQRLFSVAATSRLKKAKRTTPLQIPVAGWDTAFPPASQLPPRLATINHRDDNVVHTYTVINVSLCWWCKTHHMGPVSGIPKQRGMYKAHLHTILHSTLLYLPSQDGVFIINNTIVIPIPSTFRLRFTPNCNKPQSHLPSLKSGPLKLRCIALTQYPTVISGPVLT